MAIPFMGELQRNTAAGTLAAGCLFDTIPMGLGGKKFWI